ncbi:unnamed protein product, partial [Gulo gulo]
RGRDPAGLHGIYLAPAVYPKLWRNCALIRRTQAEDTCTPHALWRAGPAHRPQEGASLGEAFLNPTTASWHLSLGRPQPALPGVSGLSSCLFPEESGASNQTPGKQFFNLQLQTLILPKLIL